MRTQETAIDDPIQTITSNPQGTVLPNAEDTLTVGKIKYLQNGYIETDGKKLYSGVTININAIEGEFPFFTKELEYISNNPSFSGKHVQTLAKTLLYFQSNWNNTKYGEVTHYGAAEVKNFTDNHHVHDSSAKTKVEINVNQCDIVGYTGQMLKQHPNKKVALLNPANYHFIGGGVFSSNGNALEEILFRCSDLGLHYVSHAKNDMGIEFDTSGQTADPIYINKMKIDEVWYANQVQFIKRPLPGRYEEYTDENKFTVGVIGSAAPFYNKVEDAMNDPNNEYIVKAKIRAQLVCAIQNDVNIPILTALGCGAFHNNPKKIAQYYYDILLNEGYAQYFDSVSFAIWDKQIWAIFDQQFRYTKELDVIASLEHPTAKTVSDPTYNTATPPITQPTNVTTLNPSQSIVLPTVANNEMDLACAIM